MIKFLIGYLITLVIALYLPAWCVIGLIEQFDFNWNFSLFVGLILTFAILSGGVWFSTKFLK
jgi:hypothetical protein